LFRLTDSSGAFVNKAVTIWDFGRDEPPIIQGPDNVVVDLTASGGPVTVSGHFFFNDADVSDTHSLVSHPSPDGLGGVLTFNLVQDTTQGVGGEVQWTYTLDTSGMQYLGVGDTASASWPITVYGNNDAAKANGFPVNGPGMSTSENITFVVHGVNDDPYFRTGPWSITELSNIIDGNYHVDRADNIGFSDFDPNDTHFALAVFDAAASGGPEVGHLDASVIGDTTGGTNVNGLIHWTYKADADGTAAIHQVYDIVLRDNHGGQVIQPFTIDLVPHV
jgi:predicted secreted protein